MKFWLLQSIKSYLLKPILNWNLRELCRFKPSISPQLLNQTIEVPHSHSLGLAGFGETFEEALTINSSWLPSSPVTSFSHRMCWRPQILTLAPSLSVHFHILKHLCPTFNKWPLIHPLNSLCEHVGKSF